MQRRTASRLMLFAAVSLSCLGLACCRAWHGSYFYDNYSKATRGDHALTWHGYHAAWYVSGPAYVGETVGAVISLPFVILATPPAMVAVWTHPYPHHWTDKVTVKTLPGSVAQFGIRWGGTVLGFLPRHAYFLAHSYRGELPLDGLDQPEAYAAYWRARMLGDFGDQLVGGKKLNDLAPEGFDQCRRYTLTPHVLLTCGYDVAEGVSLDPMKQPVRYAVPFGRHYYRWVEPWYDNRHIVLSTPMENVLTVFKRSGEFLGYARYAPKAWRRRFYSRQGRQVLTKDADGQPVVVTVDRFLKGADGPNNLLAGSRHGYARRVCRLVQPARTGPVLLPDWAFDLQVAPAANTADPHSAAFSIRHRTKGWTVGDIWSVLAQTQDTLYLLRATEGQWKPAPHNERVKRFEPSRYAVVAVDTQNSRELFTVDCGNRFFHRAGDLVRTGEPDPRMFVKRIGLVVDSEYAYILLPKAGPDATPIKGLRPTDSPKLLIDALWGDDVLIVNRRTGEFVR